MSDDFLKEHQAAWRAQPDEFQAVRDKLKRERWAPHRALAIQVVSAAVGIAFGVSFGAAALATGSVLYALAAVVMAVGLPGAMAIAALLRRDGFAWDDETPESLLRTGVRRADASLKAVRFAWSAPGLFAAFVIALWIGVGLGYIEQAWFAVMYTGITVFVLALTWPKIILELRRLKRERATYARLLAEYEAESSDDGETG